MLRKLLIHTVGRIAFWVLYRFEIRPDGMGKATLHVVNRWSWSPDIDLHSEGDSDRRWIVD